MQIKLLEKLGHNIITKNAVSASFAFVVCYWKCFTLYIIAGCCLRLCRFFPCPITIFIHSFSHFYSAPSSPLLLRGAPDYSTDTVSEFHAEEHRQLQLKDLPKVLTWRLERVSRSRTHDPPVESHRLNQGVT